MASVLILDLRQLTKMCTCKILYSGSKACVAPGCFRETSPRSVKTYDALDGQNWGMLLDNALSSAQVANLPGGCVGHRKRYTSCITYSQDRKKLYAHKRANSILDAFLPPSARVRCVTEASVNCPYPVQEDACLEENNRMHFGSDQSHPISYSPGFVTVGDLFESMSLELYAWSSKHIYYQLVLPRQGIYRRLKSSQPRIAAIRRKTRQSHTPSKALCARRPSTHPHTPPLHTQFHSTAASDSTSSRKEEFHPPRRTLFAVTTLCVFPFGVL